jgi:hypothetical protein
MARPEFTPSEEFVIAYYRDRSHLSFLHTMGTELACIVATLACIGYGLYKSDTVWVCAGLAPMVYLQLVSAIRVRKYMRAFHSIFMKYESALAAADSVATMSTDQVHAPDSKAAGDP